ncbi:MAG: CHC2 zinc finger domain-containing protein [Candidatus Methanoperedens sp.]|nr:CHC2 zinc finger domain-containing protein [Candidatus Methanoperedens sp.]
MNILSFKCLWHCFGCGRGGDVIALVMEIEGVDFVGAVKRLSDEGVSNLFNIRTIKKSVCQIE